MNVNITLDKNDKINGLMIKKDSAEKKKVSWSFFLIGLLMFVVGVYESATIIFNLFAK